MSEHTPDPAEWGVPADLRNRIDAYHLECQDSLSGRWRSLHHRYWNDCVIPVRWRDERVRSEP